MANHSSTKKAIRKTVRKTAINKNRASRVKTYVKKVLSAVEAKDKALANSALIKAQSELMRAASHNILKKNNASRRISRLAKKVKAIA